MGSARDHKENERFRDHSQEGDASMSDMEIVANGALPAQHSWEEWLERTSREQILILRENNRKKDLHMRRKWKLLRISRFVIPAAVASIVIFLCAVPTGRAFAGAAIENISGMIDRYFYLQSMSDGKLPAGNEVTAVPSVLPSEFDKIKSASQHVKEPLLYIGKKGLVVSDVSVEQRDAITKVQIEYRTSENDSITTRQIIAKNQANRGMTMDTNGTPPQTHALFNGEILFCSYTREGHAFGVAYWDDILFWVSSPTLKWEKLFESVDALACVQ